MDEHREMKVTPDKYLTYRYAGASGDFNPIHLDDEFAQSVGLPGRILHGLWTMAQCARAQGDGLKLAVAVGAVPRHGRARARRSRSPRRPTGPSRPAQGDNRLVRRGKAVIRE